MKQGDHIKLKPEWMDKGDDLADFVVVEVLSTERLLITDNNSPLHIKPTQVIQSYMVE